MNRNDAIEKIRATIASNPDLQAAAYSKGIQADSRFAEDLGFDSILSIAFLCELQVDFPALTEADMANWKTVNDCVMSILEKVA